MHSRAQRSESEVCRPISNRLVNVSSLSVSSEFVVKSYVQRSRIHIGILRFTDQKTRFYVFVNLLLRVFASVVTYRPERRQWLTKVWSSIRRNEFITSLWFYT